MGLTNVTTLGLLLVLGLSGAQEDSLRSALNAIDRRQRDLEFPRYDEGTLSDYGYSFEGPDDLAFLSPSDYSTGHDLDKNSAAEHLLEYLEDGNDDAKKRISTSFRERLEEDKERQMEELAQRFLAEDDRDDNEDYSELIKELWKKYRNFNSRPRVYTNDEIKKRYYPGLRKRNKYYDSDLYDYESRDNFVNKYQDDDIDANYYDWKNKRAKKYIRQRTYNSAKRFPVSKRSSEHNEHKRSTTRKDGARTDPKVAKELSNIFGTVTTQQSTIPTEKPKLKQGNKEQVDDIINEKPLQIKKKSIKWSDYFGLDRRKKSDDELDNEWLMERYHKSVALTAKRNAEYPLQSFKNHEQPDKKELELSPKKEDEKVAEMDTKLRNMEDTIIDDALKYTGARQGTTDSQEIQDVKDRVISRLAAAYSLEKMRRALREYKLGIAKERQKHKNDDYDIEEEKRVSVPRKQAIDEERAKTPEAENNIKCAQGDDDCQEQSYRTPSEILERAVFEECPKIRRACSEVAALLGDHAGVFETACSMHQMCLICSNNSWFQPTRQCNVLFLNKAYELCGGKQECHNEAQKSVRYLLDVNRSLRSEPLLVDECELACPDRR